jgi:cysteine synthase
MLTSGFPGSVGNTPLIRIPSLSEATGCHILGKAEFMNPGGSIKDRAAKQIVEEAEASGQLKAGGTIVEGTAGNTGIGLALMANAKGYRCSIVMPNNQSSEKIDYLRALGAEVELVPPAPFKEPTNYYHIARVKAEGTPNGFWANQFENEANHRAHIKTTGPEIWRDTAGKIDGIVVSAGTGGTAGGLTSYLKNQDSRITSWLIDPPGSGMYNYIKTGEISTTGSSVTEGIGIMRITANFKHAIFDDAVQADDTQMTEMAHWVLRHDGLFIGTTAALNLIGAVRLARKLGKGKTVVTILCDGGNRYLSKLYNKDWKIKANLVPKNSATLDFIGT